MAANLGRFSGQFQCPNCASDIAANADGFACQNDHRFAYQDGVLDFGGTERTQLDAATYDHQKKFSDERSRAIFGHLKIASRGAIGDNLGTVLEVGAGTGLLTFGLLADGRPERAVITDISAQMLALCASRIGNSDSTLFATYGAGQKLLADSSFDLCVAHSVLHHVGDYRSFLADIAKALKPGGAAIFCEPAAPYHDAMTRALADALCMFIFREGARECADDLAKMASWITDIRYRLAFPQDEHHLSLMEDKFMFTARELKDAGSVAGFGSVDIHPNLIDTNASGGVREYAKELGLTEYFMERFVPMYSHYASSYFTAMEQDDMSGMYVCVFTR